MKNRTSFQPGQSGNPKGRPPKKRALADMLEKLLKAKQEDGGRPAKEVFAERVVEGLTTGIITFPEYTSEELTWHPKLEQHVMVQVTRPLRIVLDGTSFISLAKTMLMHLDGPVPANVDLSSGGKPLNVLFDIGLGSPEDAAGATSPDDNEMDGTAD